MAKAEEFTLDIETAAFAGAVQQVAEVVERRNSIPILGTIRIRASGGFIELTCTDLDMELQTTLPGEGQGTVCVPALRLRNLLAALPHVERVTMKAEAGGVVALRAEGFLATMFSMSVGDFVEIGMPSDLTWSANLAEGVFSFLMGGVAHAISRDDARYYLNGAALEIRDGALVAIATDGHRLAVRESTLPSNAEDHAPVIVPNKAVTLALRLGGKGEAKLVTHPGVIEITFPDLRLRAKLIDGTFPDWRRVIPAPSPATIVVEVAALRRAVRLARASASERGRPATLDVIEAGLRVTSNDPDGGWMEMTVGGTVDPELGSFGLNPRYLDDTAAALQRLGSKTLRIEVKGGGHPLRITPDEAIRGALNVLMPMRV